MDKVVFIISYRYTFAGKFNTRERCAADTSLKSFLGVSGYLQLAFQGKLRSNSKHQRI